MPSTNKAGRENTGMFSSHKCTSTQTRTHASARKHPHAPIDARAHKHAHWCRKTSWLSSSRFQDSVCTCDCRVFFLYTAWVGDTLLEGVRTARTVAAHGKVAMILPVPPQDLRTVTEALSCGICKGNLLDDILQSYRSFLSSSYTHTHMFNVHTRRHIPVGPILCMHTYIYTYIHTYVA